MVSHEKTPIYLQNAISIIFNETDKYGDFWVESFADSNRFKYYNSQSDSIEKESKASKKKVFSRKDLLMKPKTAEILKKYDGKLKLTEVNAKKITEIKKQFVLMPGVYSPKDAEKKCKRLGMRLPYPEEMDTAKKTWDDQ